MEVFLELNANLDINNQVLIYCNSQRRILELEISMKDHGYAVSAMHSGMDQMNRDAVTKEFRTGAIRVLIADGLLARRMDF